ncbi:DUF6230 family protein [Natrinema salsiterrestre]|uniref:DUF6230 family protein n=1 Tax=Natrinema salsiterrestre TaxID=2950540 RepID=A0A9Q4Q0S0_9EURY|nr:DUF6230 family protein [Natrinema salsiterrestre]MDF9744631.1 DUF6230 family protein [Natrinema salsiterrestre]
MPTDRKKFIVAFLGANVLLISVVGGFATTGTSVAVPMSDTGGFTVAFDELEGNGFEQYSTMEDNGVCEQYPVSETRIDNGTIEGLHLFKDLEMPVANDTVRVSIRADSMEFEGLTQRFTYLEGDLSFDGEQVVEYDDDRDRMRISARNITIENSSIQTENQYITYLSLDELDVDVETNPDDAGVDAPDVECLSEGSSDGNQSSGNGSSGNQSDDISSGGNESGRDSSNGNESTNSSAIGNTSADNSSVRAAVADNGR